MTLLKFNDVSLYFKFPRSNLFRRLQVFANCSTTPKKAPKARVKTDQKTMTAEYSVLCDEESDSRVENKMNHQNSSKKERRKTAAIFFVSTAFFTA